jgi:hypothetical protein
VLKHHDTAAMLLARAVAFWLFAQINYRKTSDFLTER